MSVTTKADFLAAATKIAELRVLSGQEVPEDKRLPGLAELLATSEPVALVGADVLVGDADDYTHDAAVQQALSAHANAGGAVILCMHPPNFFSGTQRLWGSGTNTDKGAWVAYPQAPKPNLSTLLSGTALPRQRYLRAIQRVIAYIKTLPPTVAVVFRPWHEADGSWFWWGLDQTNPGRSESGVKALWADTMRQVQAACPNVTAGFSAGMSYSADELYGFPSSGVEVVGASLYSDTATFAHAGDYDKLVSTGKPVFLFEVGNADGAAGWDLTILRDALATQYPRVVGFVCWQDGRSLIESKNASLLLSDPRTLNRNSSTVTGWVFADHDPGVLRSVPLPGDQKYPIS